MPQGIVANVLGIKTRFCNGNCRDNFKEDRSAGLIYPPCAKTDDNGEVIRDDNGKPAFIGWQDASHKNKWCAYCRETLPGHGVDEYWLVYAEKGNNPSSDQSRFLGAWKADNAKSAAQLAKQGGEPIPKGWKYVVAEHFGNTLDPAYLKN